MEVSTKKTEGKLHHARSYFGVVTFIKTISTIPLHFIFTLLNAYFDFDVSVANDVAISVAKCALLGKVMKGSPCPEVHTASQ